MSGVNLVLQLCPKILKTNQLAVFFKYQYIREELINILDFFLHQGKIELGTTFLVGFGQLHVSSNQIAGFFDHRHLWKESTDILVFFKVASNATTCGWVWPGVSLVQSSCMNF